MTPQERQLVADLFDKLAALEREPRDPEAERLIREGLQRAPNAVYSLVQTVLLQDEALRVANQRIEELEQAQHGAPGAPREDRGFLDNMRDSLFGRDEPRGSVPRTGERPMGVPPGYGGERPDPWGRDQGRPGGAFGGGPTGGPMQGTPMQGTPMQGGGSGGSFLGTAAAAAAGAIGGGLLLNGIRNMLGGQGHGAFAGAFDQLSGNKEGASQGSRSPWESGGTNDLARDAGVNDIGQDRRYGVADAAPEQSGGSEDASADEEFDVGELDDGGYDDSDTA
jgi:hypothetical protein